jgi:hypothetical protein
MVVDDHVADDHSIGHGVDDIVASHMVVDEHVGGKA